MADKTESPEPAKAGFFSRIEKTAEADVKRVVAAIEAWYAKHYHSAAVAGRAPISVDEKAALIEHVTAAVTHEEQ